MKKKFTVLLLASLLLVFGLAACGANDNNEENDVNQSGNDNLQENEDVDKGATDEGNNSEAENNESGNTNEGNDTSSNNESSHSDLDEFEEGEVIQNQIQNLEDLNVVIETDNDNNRIILFKDGNIAQYKSVYVKHDNHLKIINIKDDEGLLFEGTLQ